MSSIRTNAHPVILASIGLQRTGEPHASSPTRVTNVILDVARDFDSGDTYGEALELLWATQNLRMAYDSPRIGGGIDPAIATNLPGLDDARQDCALLDYILESTEHIEPELMQDMIVHAEAVASRLVSLADLNGTSY